MPNREKVQFKTEIEAQAEDVYRWHWQPGTIERLIPPWESMEVVQAAPGPEEGARAKFNLGFGPFKINWIARHSESKVGRQFVDVQEQGPFAYWRHVHKIEPLSQGRCALIDQIQYELPASCLSSPAIGWWIKKKLQRLFKFRHEVTACDMAVYTRLGGKTMKILVSGSHGMVGSHLVPYLTSKGHQVVRLVRNNPQGDDIVWDPVHGEVDKTRLEGFDAVVHLAGDNIAEGRWTESKKEAIRSSRVKGTNFLARTLASLEKPPGALISASAIGYYGDRSENYLLESSSSGSGFLAEVCRQWESAAGPAKERGIRVVTLRIGVVLSGKGGALKKLVAPFQMGLGGKLGSGKQYMSWVSIEDLAGIIHHAIMHPEIAGPLNAVAPNPVTNEEFTRALGQALSRPALLPVPGFAIHLLLGQMADELLLASTRAMPGKLLASKYSFRHAEILPMLKEQFGTA